MEIRGDELKKKISEILKDADLEKITSKLVRCELEKHFKQSLTSRRSEIDKMIMQSLQARQEESEEESEDEVSPRGGDDDQSSSSDSASSLDMTPLPPKRSAKSKRDGKKGSSSRGRSSSKPLTDEELARQLHAEENGMRVRQRRNMSVLPWYARGGGAKKRSSEENGTKDQPKPKKSKKKLCVLSEELADLLGESMMARSDVVKALWSIAKERNLFDPKDRRFIICDEQFKTIFNRQRMLMFGVMKYLTRVVKDVDDIH